MVTGIRNLVPVATILALTAKATEECDLENGLADLRHYVPNAAVAVFGYHLTLSEFSNFDNTGCPAVPGGIGWATLNSWPVQAALALTSGYATNEVIDRVAAFREVSSLALDLSAAALDAEDGGRGRVLFVDMGHIFGVTQAALTSAPLVYGANCDGTMYLGPEDPIADDREAPCTDRFGPDGTNPNDVTFQSCLRASAFHPNRAAQAKIAERIEYVLRSANAWPP